MQIFKFGGTSLSTAQRIKEVATIIHNDNPKIVVLSANGKSTDLLTNLADNIANHDYKHYVQNKFILYNYYLDIIDDLFDDVEYITKAKTYITGIFNKIIPDDDDHFSIYENKWLVTRGEMISTVLFALYLESIAIGYHFLFASELIHKNAEGQVDENILLDKLLMELNENNRFPIYLTQGFICSDVDGAIDILGRGGSDYTASLLGKACTAEEIQIWSDVDGFLNNDPSLIRGALPLSNLSFNEAEELAYFGARILHPMTISPAKVSSIPIFLKNTLNPDAQGTKISSEVQTAGIKAVASKDDICLITIHSARMLMATGFLRTVFEVFEDFSTPVDMVTTSEVSVSLTIDNQQHLEEILNELNQIGDVTWQDGLSIVCVVGDLLAENRGKVRLVFDTMNNVPLRMISYGAARNSISMLIDTTDKIKVLEALNPVILESIKESFTYV